MPELHRGTRELRELVHYRAKLVALRSGLNAQAHSTFAKTGVLIVAADLSVSMPGSDLDGHRCPVHTPRGSSLLYLIYLLDADVVISTAQTAAESRPILVASAVGAIDSRHG